MNSEPEQRTSDWLSTALDRFEGRLLRYAQKIVGDDHEARDVVQDTFLKLCRQDPEQLNGRLAQWLYTVCRNRALDVRRRRTHNSPAVASDLSESRPLPGREPAPGEAVVLGESVQLVQLEISRLTSHQQECLRLKFQQELTYREISEITGLSVSNVGFLIHTGLKAVRERLRRLELADAHSQERPRP